LPFGLRLGSCTMHELLITQLLLLTAKLLFGVEYIYKYLNDVASDIRWTADCLKLIIFVVHGLNNR
jgi:hypothetical protein